MLDSVATLLQSMVGPDVLVRAAHMELADPLIPAGVDSCVAAGATELIVFPYMLSPGKHSTRDIPRMVADATRRYPQLQVRVTEAFGIHEKLAEVIMERAGVSIAQNGAKSRTARRAQRRTEKSEPKTTNRKERTENGEPKTTNREERGAAKLKKSDA